MARISKAQLVKLQKKFKTDAAIGEQFGITRQAVHQLRKKYELESSLIDNPERNADIIAAYQKGASGTTIAKKFDLSISQTYRIINGTLKAGKTKKAVPKKPVPKKAAAPKKAPAKKVVAKKAATPKVPAKKVAAKKAVPVKAPAKKAKKAK